MDPQQVNPALIRSILREGWPLDLFLESQYRIGEVLSFLIATGLNLSTFIRLVLPTGTLDG